MAGTVDLTPVPVQPLLDDPTPPYALDPLRGAHDSHSDNSDVPFDRALEEVLSAPAVTVSADFILAAALTEPEAILPYLTPAPAGITDPDPELQHDQILADDVDQVDPTDDIFQPSDMAEDPELRNAEQSEESGGVRYVAVTAVNFFL